MAEAVIGAQALWRAAYSLSPPEFCGPKQVMQGRQALVSSVAMVAECVESRPSGTGQYWSVPEKGWDAGLTASAGRADLDI